MNNLVIIFIVFYSKINTFLYSLLWLMSSMPIASMDLMGAKTTMVPSQSCFENWFSSWVVQHLAHHHSVRTHLITTTPTLAERAEAISLVICDPPMNDL
jgi:hypothetical protein